MEVKGANAPCPITDCLRLRKQGHAMCWGCWRRLPKKLQKRFWVGVGIEEWIANIKVASRVLRRKDWRTAQGLGPRPRRRRLASLALAVMLRICWGTPQRCGDWLGYTWAPLNGKWVLYNMVQMPEGVTLVHPDDVDKSGSNLPAARP